MPESPRHRATDADHENHTAEREGPFDGPGAITVGWKGVSASFKGVAVWGALVLLAILAVIFYSGLRQEWTMVDGFKRADDEHKYQKLATQMNTCVLSLAQADRDWLRTHFSEALLAWYCPWVERK